MRSSGWLGMCVAVIWMGAASAFAGPKVVFAPFTGPRGSAIRDSLVSELCRDVECVPTKKVMQGNKLDWKKVEKAKAQAVVIGNVNAVGKKAALYLTVLSADRSTLSPKRRFPLKNGRLDARGQKAAIRSLRGVFLSEGGKAEPVEPVEDSEDEEEEKGEEKSEVKTEPEELPKSRSEGRSEPVAEKSSPPPSEEEEPEAEEPPPVRRSSSASASRGNEEIQEIRTRPQAQREMFIVLEAGSEFYGRRFDYFELRTANLRRYNAPLVIAPQVSAQIYPLAKTGNRWISGLGAEASFSFSVGLTSRPTTQALPYPSSLTKLDLAVKWRLKPLAVSELTVVPQFGFRRTAFSVAPASDNTVLDGLPGVAYSALRLGVGLELPLERFFPFIGFSYLPVLSSGEIVSAAYFPSGGASGFELTLGTGFRLVGGLELRLQGQLTRYGLSFQTQDGDTYIADGAVDQYVGGTLSLRYVF